MRIILCKLILFLFCQCTFSQQFTFEIVNNFEHTIPKLAWSFSRTEAKNKGKIEIFYIDTTKVTLDTIFLDNNIFSIVGELELNGGDYYFMYVDKNGSSEVDVFSYQVYSYDGPGGDALKWYAFNNKLNPNHQAKFEIDKKISNRELKKIIDDFLFFDEGFLIVVPEVYQNFAKLATSFKFIDSLCAPEDECNLQVSERSMRRDISFEIIIVDTGKEYIISIFPKVRYVNLKYKSNKYFEEKEESLNLNELYPKIIEITKQFMIKLKNKIDK